MSRFSRQTVLALAGVVLAASYLGFRAPTSLGHGWGAPAIATVSVVCTIGEIIYACSATTLVTALARFQLPPGFGLAVSPAAITALAPHGSAALWGSLATATLLSASAVATRRSKERGAAIAPTGREQARELGDRLGGQREVAADVAQAQSSNALSCR